MISTALLCSTGIGDEGSSQIRRRSTSGWTRGNTSGMAGLFSMASFRLLLLCFSETVWTLEAQMVSMVVDQQNLDLPC